MNSLIQRLLAETSPFVKKGQILIVGILLITGLLHAYIPADILKDIFKCGITLIVGGAFTVNDATKLQSNGGVSLQGLFSLAADLPGQLQQLQDAIDGKLTLDQAKQLAGLQVVNPVIPPVADPSLSAQVKSPGITEAATV